jgi:hypothetical protein
MLLPMRARRWLPALAVLCAAFVVGGAAAAPPQKRLTAAQWRTYNTAYAAYAKQTAATVARFRHCRSSTAYTSYLGAFAKCLGNVPAAEISATNAFSSVLHRFEQKTTGACSTSLATYQGALFFWKSAVTGVKRAVDTKAVAVATITAQAGNAVTAAQKVTADAKLFVRACKPLG